MAQNVPTELQTDINRQVLDHVAGLSAHSDIVEALGAAMNALLKTDLAGKKMEAKNGTFNRSKRRKQSSNVT